MYYDIDKKSNHITVEKRTLMAVINIYCVFFIFTYGIVLTT
jgi:hypothetical protein